MPTPGRYTYTQSISIDLLDSQVFAKMLSDKLQEEIITCKLVLLDLFLIML